MQVQYKQWSGIFADVICMFLIGVHRRPRVLRWYEVEIREASLRMRSVQGDIATRKATSRMTREIGMGYT